LLRCHSTHVNTIHCLQSVAFLYQAAPQCRASRHQAADAEVASAVLRQTNSNANGRIVRIVVVGCPRSPRVLRDLALWRWRRSRPLHGLLRLGLSGGPSGSWSLLWLRANHTDIEHGPILPPETKRDLRPWLSQNHVLKLLSVQPHSRLVVYFIQHVPNMNISCPCRSPLRVHVCNSQNSPRPRGQQGEADAGELWISHRDVSGECGMFLLSINPVHLPTSMRQPQSTVSLLHNRQSLALLCSLAVEYHPSSAREASKF